MTAEVARIPAADLDALWARSEPDLELDPETGRIAPIRVERETRGRGAVDAIRAAAPVAAGAAALIIREATRWD